MRTLVATADRGDQYSRFAVLLEALLRRKVIAWLLDDEAQGL